MRTGSEARFLLHAAFRPADAEWVGFHTWPIAGEGFEWHRFVARAHGASTDRARVPRARSPYWTAETWPVSGPATRRSTWPVARAAADAR